MDRFGDYGNQRRAGPGHRPGHCGSRYRRLANEFSRGKWRDRV